MELSPRDSLILARVGHPGFMPHPSDRSKKPSSPKRKHISKVNRTGLNAAENTSRKSPRSNRYVQKEQHITSKTSVGDTIKTYIQEAKYLMVIPDTAVYNEIIVITMKPKTILRRKQRKSPNKFRILRTLLLHLLLISPAYSPSRGNSFGLANASTALTPFTSKENNIRIIFSDQLSKNPPKKDHTSASDILKNNTTTTRSLNIGNTNNIFASEIFLNDRTTTINTDTSNTPNIDILPADIQDISTKPTLDTDTANTPNIDILPADIQDISTKTTLDTDTSNTPKIDALPADMQDISTKTTLDADTLRSYTNDTKTEYSKYVDILSIPTATLDDSLLISDDKSWVSKLVSAYKIEKSMFALSVIALSSNATVSSKNASTEDSSTVAGVSRDKSTVVKMETSKAPKTLTSPKTDILGESAEPIHNTKSSISCSQRCGEDASYPCSCDERCVVHKTCCQDLAESCPELYGMALLKFRHLLTSAVRCDTMTSVLMVESCPEVPRDRDSIENSSTGDTNTLNDLQGKNVMPNLLSSAPVTDYDTGIIYANASIYDCNKQNKSLNDSTKPWIIQIGTLQKVTVSDMKYTHNLDTSKYSYIPPESPPITSTSQCYSQETLSCIVNLFAAFNIQEPLCNRAVSEYYKIRHDVISMPEHHEHYTDFICSDCLAMHQNALGFGDRFFLSGFRVLISLSGTPGYAVYDLPKDLRKQRQPYPWWSWTCKFSDQINVEDSAACRVLQCDKRFILTQNGLCRKAVIAEFSVQEQVVYKGNSCRLDPHAFARAAKCHARKHKLLSTPKPYIYYNIFQERDGINLIVIRAEMFFDKLQYEEQIIDLVYSSKTFYAAILVFAQNYCSSKTEERKMNIKHDSPVGLLPGNKSNTSRSKSAERGDIFHNAQDLKLIEMLDRFTFIVRLLTDPIVQDLNANITFNFDSVYYLLDKSARMDEFVSKVNSSKCVNVKREDGNKLTNDAATLILLRELVPFTGLTMTYLLIVWL
ncbi:hypothetical protein ElyMa_005214000 [Elysia marginata]|uniref:SMB domain-containing protein n=1 Tax=Elysia marginata TaxID=1093978 RepID=A0AAV4JWS3_9GAST|nr:hypothetical protein ElyMa_005214000 [Elysia marginata]